MAYVLMKNDYYCAIDDNRAISKTQDGGSAKIFNSRKEAEHILALATAKLKGFKIKEIDVDENINESTKEKRRQFTTDERTLIYNKNKGRCAICGRFVPYDKFTIDHIIPLSKSGTNDLNNLQCTCKTCNLIKQDILPEELMDKLEEIVVYQMKKNYKRSLYKKINRIRKERRRNKVIKIIKLFVR